MARGAIMLAQQGASFWPKRRLRGKLADVTARAMVLCAGLGTRLRPLTLELPKPLVPLGDRSLLAHTVEKLRAAGLHELVINTHHLPEAFSNVGKDLGVVLHAVHEPKIRGTAGGVAGARSLLGPAPILLFNGDIVAEPPVAELFSAASDGSLALAVVARARGEGTVGIDADGFVVRLRGQRFGTEVAGGDYIGVAGIGARCLATLPEVGCLIGDWAIPELRAGGSIRSVPVAGGFADAGDPASYLALNLSWLAGTGQRHFVAPSARVEADVELVQAVVGAGARVSGRGRIERSVIWPGAAARAPLANAIVTTSGTVVVVS